MSCLLSCGLTLSTRTLSSHVDWGQAFAGRPEKRGQGVNYTPREELMDGKSEDIMGEIRIETYPLLCVCVCARAHACAYIHVFMCVSAWVSMLHTDR